VSQRLFCLIAFAALAAPLNLQAQLTVSTLRGTVTDPTGAVVPNVSVTATNLATGIQTQTTTGAEGDYRFSFLSPGNYTIVALVNGRHASSPCPLRIVRPDLESWTPSTKPGPSS